MRHLRTGTLALAVLAILALPQPAQAADEAWSLATWEANGSTWEGTAVGTVVHHRITTRVGDRVVSTHERKERLAKATETAYTIEVVQILRGEAQSPVSRQEPRGNRQGSLRRSLPTASETLTLAGKAWPCERHTVVRTLDGETTTTTLWVHPEEGILRFATGVGAQRVTVSVRTLSLEKRVGDRTLACRAYDLEGPQGKGTLVLSAEVPDRVVSQTTELMQAGKKVTLTQELIAITRP